MANTQNEEFQFPDEIEETKGKPVEAQDDGGFELEIQDDTPVEDQKAKPLPNEVKEELEKDNLMEYSNKVKMRLEQMKKAWHDERRAKETADREREEAINYAKKVSEDNKKLKERYSAGEKEFITTAQSAADFELEIAKRSYRDAVDSGDTDRMVEAQAKLTEASLKQDKVKNFRPTLQEEDFDVQMPQTTQTQESPKIDPLTSKWLEKNTWYGPDEEMTALALGTHAKLEKEFGKGYIGTEEYFKRIDNTMRKRFPENFSEEEAEVETQAGGDKPSLRSEARASSVVAPATRSTASKRIVLKASQVALAKKLGLTPEQYAREMQKLEA
jgi:hypothetical protein